MGKRGIFYLIAAEQRQIHLAVRRKLDDLAGGQIGDMARLFRSRQKCQAGLLSHSLPPQLGLRFFRLRQAQGDAALFDDACFVPGDALQRVAQERLEFQHDRREDGQPVGHDRNVVEASAAPNLKDGDIDIVFIKYNARR